jgi:beta-galactosidase
VIVDLQRVSTDAVVYVDDIECGKVFWPYGEVDITAAVKPGVPQQLRILVVAVQNQTKVLSAMGPGQEKMIDAHLESCGIIGEVFLASRPKGPHVSDVFVRPSTRTSTLGLTLEFAEVTVPGPVALIAHILDGTKEVKRFTGTVMAGGNPVETSWPWADAKRWDFAQPNLYTLLLEAKGAGIDDAYSQEFGFRECWIEGRTIMLNGTPFRLRPNEGFPETGMLSATDSAMDGWMSAGFNIIYMWPTDQYQRGLPTVRPFICERADRKGLPVMAPALSAQEIVNKDSNEWTKPEVRGEWERRMAAEMKRYRNHPSVLIWSTTPVFGNGDDQDPRRIGRRYDDPEWAGVSTKPCACTWQEHMKRGNEMCQIMKKHDPTRPILTHTGGPVSDIYTANNYLDLIPLQEREEWLSAWAMNGTMPYSGIEFGTPLHVTMNRGRSGFGEAQATEPWMTEFCAIYQGSAAYSTETAEYRAEIAAKFQKQQSYSGWQGNSQLNFAPAFQELERLFVTNTWRSWRTMGITAGMVPWSQAQGWQEYGGQKPQPPFVPGQRGWYYPQLSMWSMSIFTPAGSGIKPSGKALVANNAATLAWIAGSAEEKDVAAFTSKDHSFRTGAKLRKQVALLNDTRAEQAFSLTITATLGGGQIGQISRQGRLAVGSTRLEPVEFTVPGTIAGDKTEGLLQLTATIGDAKLEDSFPFRVFSAAPANGNKERAIAVVDPNGTASALLKALDIPAQAWTGDAAPVVMLARNALSAGAKLPADLDHYVRNGGRLLIMAQDPDWMCSHLGLRIAPKCCRRVFPMPNAPTVAAGLDEMDMRDWNGTSAFLPERPDDVHQDVKDGINGSPWWGWHQLPNNGGIEPDDRAHHWGWHWGNRGTVCSVPIEKPHCAGWRPLLECEFDLAYTPLMEVDVGKGRITFCTLDFEDHVLIDPAAQCLARHVMTWVMDAPLSPRAIRTIYLGGDAGAQQLTKLGLEFTRAAAPAADAQLIVVGPDRSAEDCIDAIKAGARVLVLPHRDIAPGLGVTVAKRDGFHGSLTPPAWPEAAGLSASDLRWRSDGSAILAQGGEPGADGLLTKVVMGKGVMIVCQIDPTLLPADEKTYFRFTRWRQTRALCQLIANLGGSFATDARIVQATAQQGTDVPALYAADYRSDFALGDDPYRYYRW